MTKAQEPLTASPGRPRKGRLARAGDKLRMAFMLLGKTWGSNTAAPNHLFNMKRWGQCGLPKSIKTVKEDIRAGVSFDRVSRYAALLNVTPSMLTDDALAPTDPAFVSAVVAAKPDQAPPTIMLQNIFGGTVNEQFLDYNRPEYVNALFELLKGFYVVYLAKVPFDVGVNKMALAIHTADPYCLRLDARFYLETEPNSLHGELHCWGAFLYGNFHLTEMQSFAVAMLPEPLRNPLIASRKPFHMSGKYLFGSEAFGREPLFALLHMERRAALPGADWAGAFEDFCRENISYQFLFPGDPEHDYALARLRGTGETGLGQDAAAPPGRAPQSA
ncbi:hypothetical protein NNJEOMEG_02361 [Fundidesulfovibrio magnetotacticus]|uniref:Uncharacterized protein n=1 Tax=Fundidesulfovibrio magnetotacticus TaxID=2730080 RepID=A0A6V8M237_9BACT|nr:hypothetical protein [Fundidesulfovibrio magnetotacticus]GFK94515.1 hypothetical protein NNJEOMEG_02361 [Fundidesulfovibrio magnetotacticus]